ncbi:tetratricopeptide repeat protein [Psychrobacillus sp. MER TA 171]|uniref:tetratricopeptide repeat protein n=1 Tax=Psychrobacillus sp. MER TA 171 TaxID=2939577 RepID=UPI002042357B|nr:tetratricopeptide repeat protein [Psychrobacillus sp. MER TA 171]MCM3356803.1 tetratricopeptide repeat protein [Psychrobacillus sp. MER TA 171]
MELNDQVYDQIVHLCNEGNAYVEKGQVEKAIESYTVALDLVPLPKNNWETSTWIYTALGDTYFLKCEYKMAKSNFYNALNCPGGIANPFILLRLGESLFECGEYDKAKENLLRAYSLEGYKIFFNEDDKYFEVIRDLI